MDRYIELLYDDRAEKKVDGAKNIMMLCLLPEGLEEMLTHESLLGVLTRTLRDEYKKSPDLTVFLLGTFLAISNYRQFHEILVENQIGDATMKIVDYQLKRGSVLQDELRKKMDTLAMMATEKGVVSGRKELELEIKKYQNQIKKQDKLLCCMICFYNKMYSVLQHLVSFG